MWNLIYFFRLRTLFLFFSSSPSLSPSSLSFSSFSSFLSPLPSFSSSFSVSSTSSSSASLFDPSSSTSNTPALAYSAAFFFFLGCSSASPLVVLVLPCPFAFFFLSPASSCPSLLSTLAVFPPRRNFRVVLHIMSKSPMRTANESVEYWERKKSAYLQM